VLVATRASATETSTRRKPDRAATERALMASALELLERDGVLAGLNLQEVADNAGVNRGLIHHYYGSRDALLRAAIEMGLEEFAPEAERRRTLTPRAKANQQFRDFVENTRYVKLLALLALSGEDFEPLAFVEQRLEDFEREREDGLFADNVDFKALLTIWDSMLLGYALVRQGAAAQLELSQAELDRRVLTLMQRLTAAGTKPPEA
jgi:AcrR family transcriptional regulator